MTARSSEERLPSSPGNVISAVLLVEDDVGDAFLVQELLTDAAPQLQVHWVRNLAQAQQEQIEADCVLLDLGLPDSQGLDGVRRVRQWFPGAAVLVLTGYVDEHRGVEAVAAGAQDYLVKGQVDGDLLARAIRYAVERRRAEESQRQLHESQLRQQEYARLERGLLPQPIISDARVSIVKRYRPGRHQALLGGDFYDVVQTPDGVLHLLIGDVCGHGTDEAALGVALRIAWRTLVLAGTQPDRILPALDQVLLAERRSEEMFATVAMLTVAPDRVAGELRLAGHPAPIVLGPEIRQLVAEPCPALGIVPGMSCPGTPVVLDGAVLMFTDGLIEGYADRGGERLGEAGLLALLEQLRGARSPAELADRLISDVEEHNGGPLTDDMALLLLRFT